ncbi:MAG: hypothetical protein JWO03_134 [Bacteroidetes bacterium]|nr:hypothetical protein [Bacteroidota bacterium]
MKKFFLIMSCIIVCASVFAQTTNSTLTIFSEDGHKFFLILNGTRMNDKPETNIRLQNLTQQYYNCKVIFDDKTFGDISKSYLPIVDANNPSASMDVTYKIKADKNGKQVLRYFSSQPLAVTATPVIPSDVVVYNYGTTVPVTKTTVTETTTTTQGTTGNVGMNVNGLGVNMNVQITDPNAVQQTTTTTTYTTTTTASTPPPAAVVVSNDGPCAYPMSNNDYQSAKASINNTGFDETKLKSAKSIISNNCMYANQIADICRLFGFEETKLDFAKYAYQFCYDRKNYFKVNDVFGFDSSKEELSRFTTR